jgi:site-specific recombinase XerD
MLTHSKSFSPAPITPLSYERMMELFHQCGDRAPETLFRGHPELSHSERGATYFLRMSYASSELTIQTYARALERFFKYLGNRGIQDFTCVTPEHLSNYISFLRHEGLKPNTINTYMATLKSFYKLMVDMGMLQGNPARIFRRRIEKEAATLQKRAKGKLSGHVTKTLTMDEIQSIMEHVETNEPSRDAVLFNFLYMTGARAREASTLRWEDVYDTGEDGWFAKLYGKGSKEREVYLPSPTVDRLMLLRAKMHRVPPYAAAPGIGFFPVFTLQNSLDQPMTYDTIYKVVRKCCRNAGLKKDISPHWLRHSHATHLKKHGATLEQLQRNMGHSSLTTTQQYVHRNGRDNPPGKLFEK